MTEHKLLYGCGGELILLIFDKDKEKLEIASSKTEYKIVKHDYKKMLFDTELEYEQSKTWSEDELIKNLDKSMNKIGYAKRKI